MNKNIFAITLVMAIVITIGVGTCSAQSGKGGGRLEGTCTVTAKGKAGEI